MCIRNQTNICSGIMYCACMTGNRYATFGLNNKYIILTYFRVFHRERERERETALIHLSLLICSKHCVCSVWLKFKVAKCKASHTLPIYLKLEFETEKCANKGIVASKEIWKSVLMNKWQCLLSEPQDTPAKTPVDKVKVLPMEQHHHRYHTYKFRWNSKQTPITLCINKRWSWKQRERDRMPTQFPCHHFHHPSNPFRH